MASATDQHLQVATEASSPSQTCVYKCVYPRNRTSDRKPAASSLGSVTSHCGQDLLNTSNTSQICPTGKCRKALSTENTPNIPEPTQPSVNVPAALQQTTKQQTWCDNCALCLIRSAFSPDPIPTRQAGQRTLICEKQNIESQQLPGKAECSEDISDCVRRGMTNSSAARLGPDSFRIADPLVTDTNNQPSTLQRSKAQLHRHTLIFAYRFDHFYLRPILRRFNQDLNGKSQLA